VPRDREASFEPQLVAKGETRWHGFDDKIATSAIGAHLQRAHPARAYKYVLTASPISMEGFQPQFRKMASLQDSRP